MFNSKFKVMKKIYLLLVSALTMAFSVQGATHNVGVIDNVFTPDNMIVNVGDTIIWSWQEGNHTTTSTNIPVGATQWDANINQNNPVYMYVVTMQGEYDYQCTFHALMGMVAHFTAMEASAISENPAGISLNVNANPLTRHLKIDLDTRHSGLMELSLNDITGRQVKLLASANQSAGEHHYEYDVADLPRGMYLLKVSLENNETIRKVILQ